MRTVRNSKIWGVLSESTLLEYNYGLQACISDSSKIWVVYQIDNL